MILELKNVGKIKDASIKLDGITVIAGANNTGKSTVGKMLYCVFNSFFEIEEQIKFERTKTISRVIANYHREISNRLVRGPYITKFANRIVENRDNYVSEFENLEGEIEQFYLSIDNNMEQVLSQEVIKKISNRVYDFLQIEDEEIVRIILKKRLDAEFSMNIGHLNSSDKVTEVNLSIKKNNINFKIMSNEEIELKDYLSLIKDIIYIDDPFILDSINKRPIWEYRNSYGHVETLIKKLSDRQEELSVLDEVVVKQKLERIFKVMNEVCDGGLFVNDSGNYVYKTDTLNGDLDVVNLSTGMKSFAVLKQLLKNGSIDENGIIIMDEPEIHLHPEWQLKFAEVMVLIQKEFDVNILLNTHSPYFLNAVEVYSQKYELGSKCNYYMTDEDNMATCICDVTGNVEKIYEKLAKPLQILENLEYR